MSEFNDQNKTIYLADDDENIRKLLLGFLSKEGYKVQAFPDGEKLLAAFIAKPADLVLLDIMMPGRDGLSILSELRRLSSVPIIMLTARDMDMDFVMGIQLGSDDYITKPFSPINLTMKIRAIFRRIAMDQAKSPERVLAFGDLALYSDQKLVQVQGERVDLAPNEYALLQYLLENQERAVSREELLDKVWGYQTAVETRVTDDTLKRLRKKIHHANAQIETIWGYGFRLKKKDSDEA